MAKKKSSAAPSRHRARDAAPAQAFNPKASRVKRIETAEEAEGGDEDEFHRNRDTVLFEHDGKEDREGLGELSDDDEVFGLDLPSDDEFDAEAEDDDEEGEDDDEEEEVEDADPSTPFVEPPRGRFAKSANPSQDQLSDQASSDADEAPNKTGSDSEDDEETWGANGYHASRRAPGEPDSSDDEALGMEADEARRLQKRARGALGGADFGMGDGADGDGLEGEGVEEIRMRERGKGRLEDALGAEGEAGVDKVAEGADRTEDEAIAYLLQKSPETLALLDDFTETAARMKSVERHLEEVRAAGGDVEGTEHPALAIMELEHQALATYLPTLAFYFSLLLTPAPASDLVTKVLARLASLRSALATMEELDLTSAQVGDSDDSEEEEEDGMELDESEEGMLASELWDLGGAEAGSDSDESEEEDFEGELEYDSEDDDDDEEVTDSMLEGLDDDELEQLMLDMADDADADMLIAKVQEVRRAKMGLPPLRPDGEEPTEDPTDVVGEKRKRRSKSDKKAAKLEKKNVLNLMPVLAPLPSSSASRKLASLPPKSSSKRQSNNDDYLDATSLSQTDSSDKALKRHTLRFHVSQVHQKSLKRESGNGLRVGGDDDLPRRSKEAARREVLKRQEHGGRAGEALDGQEWGERDEKDKRDVLALGGGGDGGEEGRDGAEYYDLVKKGTEEGKKAKKAKYEHERSADKAALDELADNSAAGPRGATRKILANKGLQPKRAKVNRNPRVKKRLRYDKAVKKVASMKSVYKGGQASLGHGEYQGEKSGIGAKVVKSVRLGGN